MIFSVGVFAARFAKSPCIAWLRALFGCHQRQLKCIFFPKFMGLKCLYTRIALNDNKHGSRKSCEWEHVGWTWALGIDLFYCSTSEWRLNGCKVQWIGRIVIWLSLKGTLKSYNNIGLGVFLNQVGIGKKWLSLFYKPKFNQRCLH